MAEIRGLAEVGRRLRALPPELGSKGGGPLRSALFQGAKVLVAGARRRVKVTSGQLRDSIISKRHPNPKSVGATERYDIGMKGGTRRLANTRRNRGARRAGQIVRTAGKVFYGRFLELGTAKMPAQPYLRPTIEGDRGAALNAFSGAFLRAVDRAEKKLGRHS
ncbi:MAG TPA: HK97-gp10 family putative phage morphogenesis protein [Lysobacter sp.]